MARPPMPPRPIEGSSVRRGPDMAKSEKWLYRLSSEVMAEAGFSRSQRATETPFNLILEARK